MFHEGDLSSGISTALQQQKLVLCFVREDGNEESDTWENNWLHQEDENGTPFGERLVQKAVLLKIEHGSQEAGFLGAFCTIDNSPMIVMSGEKGFRTSVDWTALIRLLLLRQRQMRPLLYPSPHSQNQLRSHSSAAAHREAEAAAIKARQDSRKKEAEEAYAAHKGKGKASEVAEETEKQKARDAWIYQQKQRKDEAKRERQRILNQIEADKQERKVRSQMAKQSSTEASGNAQSSPLPESRLAGQRRSAGAGGMCSIQVRLFDGSSIRNRFSTSATLDKDVRAWIKEASPPGQGGADVPFTFRQILAPQPSRSIEVSEEHQSLAELGLVPNGTLVLVPISGYTEAYSSSGASGVFGMLSGAWNSLPNVSYFLPSFSRLYMGGTSDPQEPSNAQGASMAGAEAEPRDEAQGQAGKSWLRREEGRGWWAIHNRARIEYLLIQSFGSGSIREHHTNS
ncbi:hypothetical protein KC348_g80 [Hortaea werneckii]|nr:hypothetical protein KC348_g80 [Hortaea werneckii]